MHILLTCTHNERQGRHRGSEKTYFRGLRQGGIPDHMCLFDCVLIDSAPVMRQFVRKSLVNKAQQTAYGHDVTRGPCFDVTYLDDVIQSVLSRPGVGPQVTLVSPH